MPTCSHHPDREATHALVYQTEVEPLCAGCAALAPARARYGTCCLVGISRVPASLPFCAGADPAVDTWARPAEGPVPTHSPAAP